MVTMRQDDLEPLDQFVAREGAYVVPWDRSPEESVKGDAKRHRTPSANARFTTKEETATGRALAAWWVKLLDVWVAADALPPAQREVIRLYFLTEHRCEGSGRFVGHTLREAPCADCAEWMPGNHQKVMRTYPVDRAGCLVEHSRQYGNEDVARAMNRTDRRGRPDTRWVQDQKRAAIETIRRSLWPPTPST